jgi:DNA-directed RNA polymerase subunit RPC12/RpoP
MEGWPEIGTHPNEMVCVDCGTRWYSAAAESMVAQGVTCDRCGGRLVLANDEEEANDENDS